MVRFYRIDCSVLGIPPHDLKKFGRNENFGRNLVANENFGTNLVANENFGTNLVANENFGRNLVAKE